MEQALPTWLNSQQQIFSDPLQHDGGGSSSNHHASLSSSLKKLPLDSLAEREEELAVLARLAICANKAIELFLSGTSGTPCGRDTPLLTVSST